MIGVATFQLFNHFSLKCSDTDRVTVNYTREDSEAEPTSKKPLKVLYTMMGSKTLKSRTPGPQAGPSRSSCGCIELTAKWRTIYVIGGSRVKRLAAHARSKLPDPRLSNDLTAYDVAEVGEQVGCPTRNDGRTWLAILETAGLNKEDIVLMDVFNNAAWEDVGSKKGKQLPTPHMLAPIVPSIANNKRLQDAIKTTRTVIDALPYGISVILLPPHARYLSGPCCLNHMAQ